MRTLSLILPDEFPFQPNWAVSHSHFAFWELCPTIDHLVPVARGGVDGRTELGLDLDAAQLRRSAWTLEELGWTLAPAGDHTDWDGLAGWFVDYLDARRELMADTYLARWFRVTVDVRSGLA